MTPRTTIAMVLALFALYAGTAFLEVARGKTVSGEAPLADSGPFSLDMDDFEGRKLVWSYFQALAERDDVMIIDVRSGFLPEAGDPPGLDNVRPIPIEIFLTNFAARKVHQDKTLLIFDKSGLELPRLQFHLRKNGYEDYFFLDGGAEGALTRHLFQNNL